MRCADDDCANVSIYPRARFVSEFGFQSHTSFIGYKDISEEQDWSPDSELFLFRSATFFDSLRVVGASLSGLFIDVFAFDMFVVPAVSAIRTATLSCWRK
jgi:hypothetical protein